MSLLFIISIGFSLRRVSVIVIQPLSLGFILISIVLCIRILIGIVIFRWYGYLLFLIYVGGMLVIFAYVISLIPNFIFISSKVVLYFFSIFFGFVLMNFFIIKDIIGVEAKDIIIFNYSRIRIGGGRVIIIYDNFFCYLLLGFILLFVLISVVKICYYCEGPLRVFKFK